MRSNLVAILAAASLLTGAAYAQQTPKHKGPPPAPAAAPQHNEAAPPPAPQGSWGTRCGSAARTAPLECVMEQTMVAKTGQQVIQVNVRVPGDTRVPAALIQLPFGLNVQAGTRLQIDEGKAFDLPIQTCENRGCYAGAPVSADLLAALKSGKQLKVSFQNMSKETITIPMPLNDFAAAYDKIK